MLNKIGFFQLDNLIQGRVPFLLINLGPEIFTWYSSLAKLHLEKSLFVTTEEQILPNLQKQDVPDHAAIILLCPDGVRSTKISIDLEKKGYTNVYVIDGGYQQLMTERSGSW